MTTTPGMNAFGAPCIHCGSVHVAHSFCYGCGSGMPYSHLSSPSRPDWREGHTRWIADQIAAASARIAPQPRVALPVPRPQTRPVYHFGAVPALKVRHDPLDGSLHEAHLAVSMTGHLFEAVREREVLATLFEWPPVDVEMELSA